MSRPRLQSMIAAGRLEERPAGGDEIVGFWSKAIRAYQDARSASSSLDGRLVERLVLGTARELRRLRPELKHRIKMIRPRRGTGGSDEAS